jgi:quinohemoprotein amine dehydrogenase
MALGQKQRARSIFVGMAALVVVAALIPVAARAQRGGAGIPRGQDSPARRLDQQGFPIADATIRRDCGGCHRADDQGRLGRISFLRMTPEGWEETVKRMVALNAVALDPVDARAIVRYLADHQGLAPEEAKAADFEVERKMIDYHYSDKDTERTCGACHSMGRVISQRRTRDEWGLLVAMHRGYYPLADSQGFLNGPGRGGAGADADESARDQREPMDKAIDQLAKAFPLRTPEWAAWSATVRPPRLDGQWALNGYQPGKGPIFGRVTIRASEGADPSSFTTESTFTYGRSGRTVTRQGQAIVYTGFQWRGRSVDPGASPAAVPDLTRPADEIPTAWREVLFIDKDGQRAEGRWFTGAQDEFGADVQLTRVESDPLLLGTAQAMLKAGSDQDVQIFGANLPTGVRPADVSLGPGVTVGRVENAAADRVTVRVTVAADAPPGRRTLLLAGVRGEASLAVYSSIDFVKVVPESGIARVGGVTVPKQFQQFEAHAYLNGTDGKPGTADDVDLGPVDAAWSIEEYTATYHDDDMDFVGQVDPRTGLFTPNVEGPNPKRRNGTNNIGDVWIVAAVNQPGPGSADGRHMRARAHLLVSPPLYMRWFDPRGSK